MPWHRGDADMPVVHANTHAVPVSQLLPLGTGRGEMSTDKDLVSKVFPKQSLLEKFAGEETDAERSTQIVSGKPRIQTKQGDYRYRALHHNAQQIVSRKPKEPFTP